MGKKSNALVLTAIVLAVSAAPMDVLATPDPIDQWTRVVSSVGFPIGIAIYLLIRMESVITKLTDAVTKLTTVMAQKGIKIE